MRRFFAWIEANAERWRAMWTIALMEDINPREAEELRLQITAARKGN